MKTLFYLSIGSLGLFGCSQQPAGNSQSADTSIAHAPPVIQGIDTICFERIAARRSKIPHQS